MIPQTPDIMPSPLCYEGDTRNILEDTPLGTNQLSYKLGFPPITSVNVKAGGIAPSRVDINAALKLLSIHTFFVQSGNKYKYSDLLDYEIGSTVLGSDNSLYYCIQANGATEPNTVQDPISSTSYWIKIINSDGKLNADNLSVTLGAFALLNELDISSELIINALNIKNGGTGATDNKTAANNILTNIDVVNSIGTGDYIYIYSNSGVKKISLGNFNNGITASLPIGFIYFQLRSQSTPDVLFNTTGKWQDISSTYAGEFFRAVGGNSASFGSKQNEGLPTFNIVTDRAVQGQGKVLPKGEKLTSANKGLGGMASTQGYGGTSAVAIGTENTSFSQSPFPYFVPNNSIYGASTHVTPYNSAIRIWKKIS